MATIRKEGEMNLRDLYKIYTSNDGILSYNKYKEVVETFMKELCLKIIKTGFEFSMPYGCGLIKIIQLKRTINIEEDGTIRGAIDWGETNKLKAKLEQEGKVPLKVFKDEKGNKIGDNGGVPYLCYFTTSTYFKWSWTAHINMKNCLKYTFDITRTNSNNLHANIDDNSTLLYKLRERTEHGTNKDYLNRILVAAGTKFIQDKQYELES